MKTLLTRLAAVLTFSVAAASGVHAQARIAVFGHTTVQFSSTFTSTVNRLGGTITDLDLGLLNNSTLTLPLNAGLLNAATGVGELDHSSGFVLSGGGKIVSLQDFIIDSSTGTPIVTAVWVYDGNVLGRGSLFNVTYPRGLTLPLTMLNGTIQISSLHLTLSPNGAATLNKIFGLNVIPAGLDAGTATIYSVFKPLPDGSF